MSDYVPFGMCPFTQVEIGGGGSIGGFGGASYVWTHGKCIGQFCRLYTFKFDENREVYAQGCNLQFLGLTPDEIRLNFELKNQMVQPKQPSPAPPKRPAKDSNIEDSTIEEYERWKKSQGLERGQT